MMEENLVIVESPAKAKTIEKFLGKNYSVTSSYGHIRDLAKKNMGIDIKNKYAPVYIISEDKKKVVAELKSKVKKAKKIWLASDEDREGEAIAWHLAEVLDLKDSNTNRIVFNEITKEAILHAIAHPRKIDKKLVDAQQARRILDRLVGFELSPILWKKIKSNLSAGRVQSVAVRLIVEREREIINFVSTSAFKVTAVFLVEDQNGKPVELEAELSEKFEKKEQVIAFLEKCKNAEFSIKDIQVKPTKRSPAPPFTTSTLQQEASRKLSFSVAQTMSIAQKLYESGKITYMRTDSVNLSDTALEMAKKAIMNVFGAPYYNLRQFKTKSKGAQEAHEAIRPTHMEDAEISGTSQEKRLYDLIYKRTMASQMSDAQLERTTVTIGLSTTKEEFAATGEVVKFDGFLKVYKESTDDESEDNSKLIPPVSKNQKLKAKDLTATERFTHYPPRYTEASLVKKLEELGIGRPSTYAPTISTIQQRGYVVKEERQGKERKYQVVTLENGQIKEAVKTEITGAEKYKLFPSDIGMVVNDYLLERFSNILDFNFTASVEEEFDEIAEGKINWTSMLDQFYKQFHKQVEKAEETKERSLGERNLGIDPVSGKPVIVRIGRFGPMVQLGETKEDEKPKYAKLQKGQHIENITLEEALQLFRLPRNLGKFEDADVMVGIGRFGPYIQNQSKYYSLSKEDDPYTVTLDRAINIIKDKRIAEQNKIIKQFDKDKELMVLNGRYGPYITYQKNNFRIPKDKDPKALTFEDCMEIINKSPKKEKKPEKQKVVETPKKAIKAAKPKKAAATKPKAKKTAKKK